MKEKKILRQHCEEAANAARQALADRVPGIEEDMGLMLVIVQNTGETARLHFCSWGISHADVIEILQSEMDRVRAAMAESIRPEAKA